jgi:hypothetical protein
MTLLRVVEQKFGGFVSMAMTGKQQLVLELTIMRAALNVRFKHPE